jgi:hypothetical protein
MTSEPDLFTDYKPKQSLIDNMNAGMTASYKPLKNLSTSNTNRWRQYLTTTQSNNPYGNLTRSIALKSRGVSFNPYLTTLPTATK